MANRAAKDGVRDLDPGVRRAYNFFEEPLVRVLRLLASDAKLNFIAPPMKLDEKISVSLLDMTPREAFSNIAKARGFRTQIIDSSITLTRPDIALSQSLEVRTYKFKNVSVDLVYQGVCNLLGLTPAKASANSPAFPEPANTALTTSISDSQARPRFTGGLPIDEPAAGAGGGAAGGGGSRVFIQRRTNTLVVKGTPNEIELVDEYVRRNDIDVPEILVRAYILEVSTNNDGKVGLDFTSSLGPASGLTLGLSRTPIGGGPIPNLLTKGNAAVLIQGAVLNAADLTATLHALETSGRTTMLSAPAMFAVSGIPVPLVDIRKETIPVTTTSTSGGVSQPSTELKTFVTGITVEVTPRLLGNGRIALNIDPRLSAKVGDRTSPIGTIPITTERGTVSELTIDDGQAVVLGGILSATEAASRSGIPFLSKIPLLGALFKANGKTSSRSNLIIIVRAETVHRERRNIPVRVGPDETDALRDMTAGLPVNERPPIGTTRPKPRPTPLPTPAPVVRYRPGGVAGWQQSKTVVVEPRPPTAVIESK